MSKQRERYLEVVDTYKDFVDKYPESKFLKEAERFFVTSNDKLLTLKKNTNS